MNKISNISFNGFRRGHTLPKDYWMMKYPNFQEELGEIMKVARANKLHKQPDRDFFLQHNLQDGFYVVKCKKEDGHYIMDVATMAIDDINNDAAKLVHWSKN